jgi:hypothetical protein
MSLANLIPRVEIPIARESSHLLSPRETGQRGQMWKHVRDNSVRATKLTNSVGVLQRNIDAINRKHQSFSNFHPFKIYPPSFYWPNSASAFGGPDPKNRLWRTFRVRNGLVLTTTVLGLVIQGSSPIQYGVQGTDLIDLPYDEQWLYRGDRVTIIKNVQEYVVNANKAVWVFWVEVYMTSGVNYAILRYGVHPDDPPASSYSDPDGINPSWNSTNPWVSYPAPDGTHFVIGLVDTITVKNQSIVRQMQVTDIMASGAGGGTTCPFG